MNDILENIFEKYKNFTCLCVIYLQETLGKCWKIHSAKQGYVNTYKMHTGAPLHTSTTVPMCGLCHTGPLQCNNFLSTFKKLFSYFTVTQNLPPSETHFHKQSSAISVMKY